MDRNPQLSGSSGASDLSSVSSERVQPQRPPQSALLRWPEWGPVAQTSPWDGLAHPCAPLRACAEAAGTEPTPTRRSAGSYIRKVLLWGQARLAEGGATTMLKRIAIALSSLAATFLVAGAGYRW